MQKNNPKERGKENPKKKKKQNQNQNSRYNINEKIKNLGTKNNQKIGELVETHHFFWWEMIGEEQSQEIELRKSRAQKRLREREKGEKI